MKVRVHKAVEIGNLTKKGQANLDAITGYDGRGWVLPKLDGVYTKLLFNEKSGQWVAVSRTGEHQPAVSQAILADMLRLGDKRYGYIGELWIPNKPHPYINGLARKQAPQPELQLWLHDVDTKDTAVYAKRWRLAEQVANDSNYITVVDPIDVLVVMDELVELARQYQADTDNAYDGLILRDPTHPFVAGDGRDGGNFKIKPRKSLDLRVVAETVEEKPTKLGGYLTVEYNGVRTNVGSGLTQGMLEDIAENKRVGSSLPAYIGSIIEVEYLEITKDGKLREPSFKSIRHDKDKPD